MLFAYRKTLSTSRELRQFNVDSCFICVVYNLRETRKVTCFLCSPCIMLFKHCHHDWNNNVINFVKDGL